MRQSFIFEQLLGLCIMAVGFWAWTEKDVFNNISKLTTIALDPAFILICSGTITFIIGFTGCVGALRENTCLLAAVSLKFVNSTKFQLFSAFLYISVLNVPSDTSINRNGSWNTDFCSERQRMGAYVFFKFF